MSNTRYTDDTVITFGRYKGEKLANVPDNWLLWYYGENKGTPSDPLVQYIKESGIAKEPPFNYT